MIIELQRAWDPTNLGEDECGLCEQSFVAQSVIARSLDFDLQGLCPTCIEYLGKRSPQKFPSIEEYEGALQRFPHPIWASKEELEREDGDWEKHRPTLSGGFLLKGAHEQERWALVHGSRQS
jgi:hypothetical protein